MTDDTIDGIVLSLTELVDLHANNLFDNDFVYNQFRDLVFVLLEPFSNGYRNHN